jgi:hypothetical protein
MPEGIEIASSRHGHHEASMLSRGGRSRITTKPSYRRRAQLEHSVRRPVPVEPLGELFRLTCDIISLRAKIRPHVLVSGSPRALLSVGLISWAGLGRMAHATIPPRKRKRGRENPFSHAQHRGSCTKKDGHALVYITSGGCVLNNAPDCCSNFLAH